MCSRSLYHRNFQSARGERKFFSTVSIYQVPTQKARLPCKKPDLRILNVCSGQCPRGNASTKFRKTLSRNKKESSKANGPDLRTVACAKAYPNLALNLHKPIRCPQGIGAVQIGGRSLANRKGYADGIPFSVVMCVRFRCKAVLSRFRCTRILRRVHKPLGDDGG